MPLARGVTQATRDHAAGAEFALDGPPELVTGPDEAAGAIHLLAPDPPDLLVMFQATFAQHAGLALAGDRCAAAAVGSPRRAPAGACAWVAVRGQSGGARWPARGGATRRSTPRPAIRSRSTGCERWLGLGTSGGGCAARIGRVGEHPVGFDTCRMDRDALARVRPGRAPDRPGEPVRADPHRRSVRSGRGSSAIWHRAWTAWRTSTRRRCAAR